MRILYKLTLGFILISMLVGLQAYIGYNGATSIQQTFNQVSEQTLPVVDNLNTIRDAGNNIIHATKEIAYTSPDYPQYIDQEMSEIAEFSKIFERAFKIYEIKVNTYFPDEKKHIDTIRTSMQDIMRLSSELTYLKKHGNNESQINEKLSEFEKSENEFLTEVNLALEDEKYELRERSEQTENDMDKLKNNSIMFGLFSIFLAVILGFFLSNRISAPIVKLKNASYEISKGNLDTKIEINTNDEIKQLSNAFQLMSKNLKNSINETTIAKNFSENILESMVDTLFVLNPDMTIKIVNNALLHLLGYKENELIGNNVGVILLEEDQLKNFINETPGEKNRIMIQELNYLRKDGEKIPIAFSASILNDNQGKYEGIVCLGKDITEQKKANENIKASLSEKEVLLREIHHRVKNNMQIISSLLMLQTQNIKDENDRNIFIESQNRIHAMALIHEKLYQSTSLDNIDIKEYINDLASELMFSYAGQGNIKLDLNVENIPLDINYAVPCGLIMNELITNSLKYAFPAGRKGNIKIVFQSKENNMIHFAVSDDGIGIPVDMDIRNTKSLGLSLIIALAENQLHGQIILNRDHGTQFLIDFRGKNDNK